MKVKFRFSGRGGQGIKFLGTALVQVAMVANYHATLSVDYTPSVRGGPIFCDVIISSEPIAYPFCDNDADFFIALDQQGFKRASKCVCDKTISFIDSDSIKNVEDKVQEGIIYRIPINKWADEYDVTRSTNILSLGFLSEYLINHSEPELKEEHYHHVFNEMPSRFRAMNIQTFNLGKTLYHEVFDDMMMSH